MRIVKVLIASFMFSIAFFNVAHAQSGNIRLSEGEIFNRCYVKLFKNVVPRTTSLGKRLMDDVLKNKITGSVACSVLLTQSEFVENGVVRPAKSTSYPKLSEQENQTLIQNLHNFHNSWFSKKALLFGGGNRDSSTYMLRDMDEASLYITRALFGKQVPLSTLFTANQTIRGVRVTPDKENTSRWDSRTATLLNESAYAATQQGFLLSYGNSTSLTVLKSIALTDNQLVPFGKLIGVENVAPLNIPLITISAQTMKDTAQNNDLRAALTAKRTNINLFEHHGGGVLGSQTFILKNTNLTAGQVAPGANNDPDQLIARRLSSRVFEDLLCHQMPTLRESDVIADVRSNSPHGFRLSASCMACHTSLDPMATTFRGYISYRSSPNDNIGATDPDRTAKMAKGTPVIGITRLPANISSTLFTVQAPTGALNYRDHQDNLVKTPVNGTADLGSKLAASDDFYRCVTKRYYEYLTGFKVNLAERNVAEESNTAEAKFHRNKVYEIAAKLKTSQSLTKMLEDIFKSEGFVYRHYEVVAD